MPNRTPNTIHKLEDAFTQAAKNRSSSITISFTLDELAYLLAAARMQHYYTQQLQEILKEVVRIKSNGSVNPDTLHLDLSSLTGQLHNRHNGQR